MYSKRFEYIASKTLNFEGGFQASPEDGANYTRSEKLIGTNRGISTIAYEQYLGREPTLAEIKAITVDRSKAVYYKLFWIPMKGDALKSDGIAWVIFDSYIATGNLKTARRGINKAIGSKVIVETPTAFNEFTVGKINGVDPKVLIKAIITENIAQRNAIDQPTKDKFLKGWISRLNQLQTMALMIAYKNSNKIAITIGTLAGLFFLGWGIKKWLFK